MSDQPIDIEAVFETALSKEAPEERAAYLDEACRNDAEGRARVEALLEAHDDAGSFLEKPAAQFVPTAGPPQSTGDSGGTSIDGQCSLDFLAPSEAADSLGRMGQYEITEVVGRGGMGIVLKGHDPKLNRVVAVKVLAPELASNASARKRFLREGRAAAAVSHDHVVTIFGIDDGGTLPFIAMEYISGPSLEDRIKSEGTLELTEILRIGMQIASGLSAAHAQGLVHRDVKPANILLENGVEKVKITDFGLARAVDDVRMTKPGVVTGTPEYMSPEQARGESVDHRTDLFSLGSVLYAMCTGRSPFRAENTVAMIRRVCEDTPRRIEDVNPEIPGWLVQIIEELLAKSAAERFQSAAELAELLGQCLAHLQEPSVNRLPDHLEGHQGARARRRRATMRRRGWLAAAAVLLVAVGGLSLTEATGVTDMAGTVIRIVRGGGTLVIEVDDPGVSVSIDGEQLVITGAGAKEIRLAVGQHELEAVKDGKPILTESVTITRDGKRVVEVNAEPLAGAEVAEAPESEAAAGIGLQETWPFRGLDDLNALAISRDGRYCAFIEAETGGLAVRDLSTGKDQLLNAEGAYWRWASISPGNKWVAYTEWSGSEGRDLLRVAGIDGSQDRILYPNEEKNAIRFFEWSPDSQHVVASFYSGESGTLRSYSVRIVTISVADGSMRVLKTLTPEENGLPAPRFSPDGRYVAYGRIVDAASKQEDIFLIPLDGGPEIPLIEGPANEDIPRWMPDGNNLLFRGNRRGEVYDSWMIRVVDGKPVGSRRLVAEGTTKYLRGPVRTPTGGWAFYYTEKGESKLVSSVHLGALDPDTGKLLTAPKLISRSTTERERALSPEFSPDGKYLAYYVAPATIQSPAGPLYGPGNIVIRSLETGQDRQITLSPRFSHGGPPPGLRWNPNGLAILMRGRSEAGRIGLFQVELATGKLDPLVLNAEEIDKGNWHSPSRDGRVECDRTSWGEYSRDGATVFFIRSHFKPDAPERRTHWRVMARDLQTGEEKEICRNPEGDVGFCAFAVSPDGQRLLIGTKNALWIVPTDGGEPRELLRFEGEFNERIRWTMTWTPDSRHALFVNGNQGGAKLWRIAADGGPPEQVGKLPATSVNYRLGIHPDGRQIAFVVIRRVQQGRTRMLQMVVSDELAKEICTANLKKTGEAIEQYKKDHGDVPDGLADLYPDYLQNTDLLLCPADHSGGKPLEGAKDPKKRCSYRYMFGPGTQGVSGLEIELPVNFPAEEGMSWKEARKLQLEYYGPVVPTTECGHHDIPLLLGYDGEFYEAQSYWERSPRAEAGLLSRLKAAMQSEPDTWARRYGIERFYCTLTHMRRHHSYNPANEYPDPAIVYAEAEAALSKLLKTHLQDHPEDDVATESLAKLPRLRFPYRYYDDAEENGEGNVSLGSSDLELINDEKRGDQLVGIRFPDTPVPQGARIKRAYLQFTAFPEDAGSDKTDLVLHAELAANAEPFASVKHNITSRQKTAASVKWSPEAWTVGGERSEKQRTPDLASLVQEVVDQPDWKKGNALVLVISGSGRRNAESWDGGWSGEPMLYVEH